MSKLEEIKQKKNYLYFENNSPFIKNYNEWLLSKIPLIIQK